MSITLVFKSHNSHALTQLSAALKALSINSPRKFGDVDDVYEIRIDASRQEMVAAVVRDGGFEIVDLSQADIQAARVRHVADKLDLLGAALTGRYRSKDEPEWTMSDVQQALANAVSVACDTVPPQVLARACEAAAQALRSSVKR